MVDLKFQETINVAGTLIDRLSGEYGRWQEQIGNLQNELDCVIFFFFFFFS